MICTYVGVNERAKKRKRDRHLQRKTARIEGHKIILKINQNQPQTIATTAAAVAANANANTNINT